MKGMHFDAFADPNKIHHNQNTTTMKKNISLFVAAVIGGVASTGLYCLLEQKPVPSATKTESISAKNQQQAGTFLTNNSSLPEKEIDFTSAAEMTVNGVVHVKTEMKSPAGNYYYSDPFRDFFFGTPHQNQQPVVSSGSGVIVSADGYIVTNNHVIKGAEKVQVTINDKKTYEAEVIASDPNTDIALLKIEGQNFPYIPYGNSDQLKVGEWVLAVGNPFNLNSTVTAGIVSAKGRSINILEGDANGIPPVESFIQTDAAVNPGNSGGALVNTSGELVGINTAIKSNTGSYAGYSFAIPVNIVKKVVDDLLEYGVVQRAFIGVSIREITSELAEQKGIKNLKGVYVAGVSDDGAAKAAGILEGDIITKIGNVAVTDVPELQEQVSKFRPGNQIIVTINRNSVEKEVIVNLKNRFGTTEVVKKEETQMMAELGANFEEVPENEINKLKINKGLKIAKINGGKLRSAGIKEGFIITKVDKAEIGNYEDLAKALKNKKGGVLIEGIYPNGMRAYYGFGM